MFFDLISVRSNSAKLEDDNIAVNKQGKNVVLFYFLSVTVKAKIEFKEKISYIDGSLKGNSSRCSSGEGALSLYLTIHSRTELIMISCAPKGERSEVGIACPGKNTFFFNCCCKVKSQYGKAFG